MTTIWTEERLEQFIHAEVEESLVLDYKASNALSKSDRSRQEITKDISSFANSTGGIIIYGISEYKETERRHLPEKIDPVDRTLFSREWLEQVINSIRPRIDNIAVHPVPLRSSPTHVAFVVQIPKSSTAHQAQDRRYYKRFNFESVPMEDYEIRDVMARSKYPDLHVYCRIRSRELALLRSVWLEIEAQNQGAVYAQFANCVVYLPASLAAHRPLTSKGQSIDIEGETYYRLQKANVRRDAIEEDDRGRTKYGPSWFDPILPSRSHTWTWDLPARFRRELLRPEESIRWDIYADNAPVRQGMIALSDLEFVRDVVLVRDVFRRAFPLQFLAILLVALLVLLAIPTLLSVVGHFVSFLSRYG